MERGRYTHYSQRTTPTRRRITRLKGSFEDSNKYIRCPNCGFIVNTERDIGDNATSGNYETDAYVYSQPIQLGGTSAIISLDRINSTMSLIEYDANGDEITDFYTPRLPQVNKGCAFCGCGNLI